MHNGAKIMALAQEDLEQIQLLFHQSIGARPEIINANVRYELEIRERIVRVEEELKHQRELMLQGFEMSNKRAEELRADMNKRFEQVDKRFEEMRADMNNRFEQVDKRFEQMDKRFEQIDKHLTIITNRMDRFMFWSLGLTISAVIAIVKLT
jgi:exopolysaccharide biosynthesis predicted pyruvyltransferase EpsI